MCPPPNPPTGLAIYNSHILEFQFPMVTYKKLLGQPVGLEDLAELQPDIHRWGFFLLAVISHKWILSPLNGTINYAHFFDAPDCMTQVFGHADQSCLSRTLFKMKAHRAQLLQLPYAY